MTQSQPEPATNRPRTGEVQSVARALDLLEALGRADGLGLSELARQTALPHNTAHRLLATLAARGYVRREPGTTRYQLGYGAARLSTTLERLDERLRGHARPSMERVHRVCGETTNLLVRDGDHVVYVEQIAGTGSMRMFAEPGARVPAHASAAGKAILALVDDAEIERVLLPPFTAFTTATITDGEALRSELAGVRARGFALDREEYERAVSCVAAAIVDHDGEPVGALSVSGPTGRLGDIADYDEFGELIARSALDVSRALGYRAPSPFDVG